LISPVAQLLTVTVSLHMPGGPPGKQDCGARWGGTVFGTRGWAHPQTAALVRRHRATRFKRDDMVGLLVLVFSFHGSQPSRVPSKAHAARVPGARPENVMDAPRSITGDPRLIKPHPGLVFCMAFAGLRSMLAPTGNN
jgi:hypothetical protein